MMTVDNYRCYWCKTITRCAHLFKPVCSDCLLKAYQLLNPPACYSEGDTTEFKGILDNVTDFHG